MRILITGATGFIGRHLVARLASDHEIYALGRRPPLDNYRTVQYIQQDLSQPLDRRRLPNKVDVIIHQAALIDSETEQSGAQPFLVNVAATWELLEYAAIAGVDCFVHASTGGVYGCREMPFRETDPFNPMDLYSLTKAQAELAVQAAPHSFRKIVLRYFFVYGVGTPNPIPDYVQRAVSGQTIALSPNGKPALNPIHISDATEATIRALNLQTNEILNIAGLEQVTFADLSTLAAQIAHRQLVIQLMPDEELLPYYRSNLLADTQRMETVLDFEPQVKLADGIAELAQSYL